MIARRAPRFFQLWAEIADIASATEILGWDQETCMPPKGQEARGRVLSTLARLEHARLTAPELRDALAELERTAADADGDERAVLVAQAREGRRKIERATRVPADLAAELAEAKSAGMAVWQRARKQADFGVFRPALERLVALVRDVALHVADGGAPYDALLDEYEPGTTEAQLVPLFAELRAALAPLVAAAAASGVVVDDSSVRGSFPADKQLAFARRVAAQLGFDFDAGRIDAAAHPFCSAFAPGDVRLTWRWQEDDLRPAFFGILHETGHGLYEQGLPHAWERTPLCCAISTGVHESQSRLWENRVGRGKAFWRWALPLLHEAFPGSARVGIDALWPALHTVAPSFIRVEADETTYDLHVAVRFELERALFAGSLDVADLPGAWDDLYAELLGIRPRNAAEGVLQDIHWSMGAFGYFPTYTLGNLLNCQLFRAAGEQLGDLDGALAAGEFEPLLAWLREHVHRHGSRFSASELVLRATGRPLSSADFVAHVRATTAEVYGVRV